DEDHQGRGDADQLALTADRRGGAVRKVATELDVVPRVAGGGDGVLERLEVAHEVGVGDRLVVAHRQDGGVTGRGHGGRRHECDVVHRGQAGREVVGDGGGRGVTRGVVDDDPGEGVGRVREVRGEELLA